MNTAITTWLIDAATLAGFFLLAVAALYALALVFLPAATLRAATALNRKFSGRKALRPLEVPRNTDAFFYRHHRWVGALLLLGVIAFFLLYFLGFPREAVLAGVAGNLGAAVAGILVDSLEIFFLIANALIAVFALLMLLRPSLLKPFESVANRWLSTRRALRELEAGHEPMDEFAAAHPRVAGLLILAGVIYVTFGLLVAIR